MSDEKHEIEKICKMMDKFVDCFDSYISEGMDNVDTKEAGEVADIIKDLAEAKRNYFEGCYYETVVKAMKEGREPRYGYNRMTRPYLDQEYYMDAYLNDPEFKNNMRYGYIDDGHMIREANNEANRYGQAYNKYKMAKRHYTETHSETDHDKMKTHATEHLTDTMTTLRDIWDGADTDLRRRMKSDLTHLVEDMTI